MNGAKLIRYDAMCSAIEAARQVDEVKEIRDKAMAIQVYARQAKNLEAERHAAEIRVRAERRCGELLAELPKAKGTQGQLVGRGVIGGNTEEPPINTLAELGISKRQSAEWQALAAKPEDEFESALA